MMARRTADELFMTQALELARQGVGLASPNPCVGAIVVDERGRIVGRGVHQYAKRKHAEVLALEEAGPLARGNTLYLNLEPCCHTGRTGPCTEAILAAGVGRVVAAMRDPNPLVGGKGFEQLRHAGVEVGEGVLESEARKLNEAFAHFIRTGMPFVTLKSAMTLDGKIAGAPLNAGRRQGLYDLHHGSLGAAPGASAAARLGRDPGRHRHGHRRRPSADRPQRASAAAAFAARHSRFALAHSRRFPHRGQRGR